MSVKKYTAGTMQKALKNIREDLGDDAIILSNRKLPNGQVEITVQLDNNPVSSLPSPPAASSASAASSVEPLSLSNEKAKQLLAAVRTNANNAAAQASTSTGQYESQQLHGRELHGRELHNQASAPVQSSVTPVSATPANAISDLSSFFQNIVFQLQQDIAELRCQVQKNEIAATSKSSAAPAHNRRAMALINKKWRHIGLDDSILKSFYKSPVFNALETDNEQVLWSGCLKYIKSLIPRYARNTIENPGVYAFVGPTGAGKTTTLGKLAVRQVNRWGADNVGIVTMDSFRIGAWEQMQRLGDIIGVKTALCRQEDSLLDTLSTMRDCRFILIDTAGLSHQDERRIAQWNKLDELGDELETYLVAPANLQSSALQQLMHAYEPAHVRGIIYTKCDEVTSLGEAVSSLISAELPWVFACDGQKIPEDLQVMSVDLVMQMLAKTTKQKRWALGGHASEQETLLAKAMG